MKLCLQSSQDINVSNIDQSKCKVGRDKKKKRKKEDADTQKGSIKIWKPKEPRKSVSGNM